MGDVLRKALRILKQRRDSDLDSLCEWLRIASVSTDQAFAGEVLRAAEWAAAYLEGIGADSVEMLGPRSHPAVYAVRACGRKEAPTALVYGHYDVQPADREDGWASEPFQPEVRGECLYARGSADMKGPFFSALSALRALVAADAGLRFNLKILLEGEEEIGSPHLEEILKTRREALGCDFCLNLDAGMLSAQLPTLSTAIRGIATFDLVVSGPVQDLHSGEFGGVVHNPAQVLCELMAGLHDDRGRVTLEGFYDRVRELEKSEREELTRLPLDESSFHRRAGVPALWGEAGYSVQERIGSRPTLDIHGMRSGYSGVGSKTIIPATASAKLSTRLVPDQDPREVRGQLEDYLGRKAPPTVSWELREIGSVPPAESRADTPWARRMVGSLTESWGCRPLLKRVGGTIPIVSLLQRQLGVDCVNVGWALPDGNLHGPNENLHLPTFHRGAESLVRFFGPD